MGFRSRISKEALEIITIIAYESTTMPVQLKITTIQRHHKAKKLGAKGKRLRENKGTTASFPLEGPIPSLRFGRAIDADKIIVPAELLKK